MEHFANGVAIERDAIEVPDFIIQELVAMRDYTENLHYEFVGDTAIHRDSGTVYSMGSQKEWPIRVHPHFPPEGVEVSKESVDFCNKTEQEIYKHVLKYLEEYPLLIHSLWWRDKGHALVYEPGARLQLHQDNNVGYSWETRKEVVGRNEISTRNVLTTTLHVDDCEGGDMVFPYAGVSFPPRRGDLLIFPANYLGAHEVTIVKEGSRRISYLGWFGQGSTEPLNTPVGEEFDTLKIYDPDEAPQAGVLWQKHIERDFMESSGWSHKEMHKKYPAWGYQQTPVYWTTVDNDDSVGSDDS